MRPRPGKGMLWAPPAVPMAMLWSSLAFRSSCWSCPMVSGSAGPCKPPPYSIARGWGRAGASLGAAGLGAGPLRGNGVRRAGFPLPSQRGRAMGRRRRRKRLQEYAAEFSELSGPAVAVETLLCPPVPPQGAPPPHPAAPQLGPPLPQPPPAPAARAAGPGAWVRD